MRVSRNPKFKMSSQVHFVILCTHLVLHYHYPLGARVKIKGRRQNISTVLYHRTQLITYLLFRAIHSTGKGRLQMPVHRSLCHTGQRHCHRVTFQAIDGMSQNLTTSRLQAEARNLQLHRLFQFKQMSPIQTNSCIVIQQKAEVISPTSRATLIVRCT